MKDSDPSASSLETLEVDVRGSKRDRGRKGATLMRTGGREDRGWIWCWNSMGRGPGEGRGHTDENRGSGRRGVDLMLELYGKGTGDGKGPH